MKYNGYDVYDIIYRNDRTVKGMLEKDLLYQKTGFIALQDTEGSIWYLYKKSGILVPEKQEYLQKTYGKRDTLPRISRIRIGKDECESDLPSEDCARDFFAGLNRIAACDSWRIDKRLWKILSLDSLYDAPARMVRQEQYIDRVSILRCAYVSDRKTKRRNFMSFADWKYLTSYVTASDGKMVLVQEQESARTSQEPTTAAGSPAEGAAEKSDSAVSDAGTAATSGRVAAGEISQKSVSSASAAAMSGNVTSREVSPKAGSALKTDAVEGKASPSEASQESGGTLKTDVAGEKSSQDAGSVGAWKGADAVCDNGTGRGKAAAPDAARKSRAAKKVFADVRELLECDKRRCRLEPYEENMLYDIKRGHWDLFENGEVAEPSEKGKPVPRDPRTDIRTGVVGIDFGTKSTVVVRQDDTSAIMPIRIGAEVLSAKVRERDYENPTIIECTDLDQFMERYCGREGRPETSCEDFFVSYDAYNDYRCCPPNEFYAYYADLKQWANHEKENVVVLDKRQQEYHFGAVGSESDKIINPIELYAYYIGMYINNMRNGIYMKYLMSFPVGYSRETRQLIVASFERGIRKSLPTCVLEDEECMKEFSVRLGISEPAAYAVTALEMSDLEPEDENDRYRYGIFDFGGGTADFGFGIWRGASEEEYEVEGYDYVLECFGADSDVTLGGEKILELLAYAVFKKNRDLARRKRLTCSMPYGEQAFLGSEALISDSQIARRNMSILKEELRPLWHQEENWREKYQHGTEAGSGSGNAGPEEYIDLSLYDIDGNKQPDCRFSVDTQELISLIKERIQKGIDAFFKCMAKAFQREGKLADYDGDMYIFLAGNSSKSIFVRELFESNIQEYSDRFANPCFKLVEPADTEDEEREYVPNAKTSVAYGLIKSREGSSIKVEKNFETDAEEQTRFKYYLGRERRRHFDCRLSPVETEYGSWIRFQGAAKQTVRIYYTTDPTADVREEPPLIDNIPYKEITVEPKKGAYIFIRACEPTAIEYAVSFSEDTVGEDCEICSLDFGQ